MAIVRKKDLLKMSVSELKAKLSETETSIANELHSMKASGRPSNAGRYREAKRLRARITTFLSAKSERK